MGIASGSCNVSGQGGLQTRADQGRNGGLQLGIRAGEHLDTRCDEPIPMQLTLDTRYISRASYFRFRAMCTLEVLFYFGLWCMICREWASDGRGLFQWAASGEPSVWRNRKWSTSSVLCPFFSVDCSLAKQSTSHLLTHRGHVCTQPMRSNIEQKDEIEQKIRASQRMP